MRDLQDRFPRAQLIGGDAAFEQLVATVVGFVEAPALGLDLPLDVRGTAFQQRVWQALREIPAGATASYAEIAAAHRRAEGGARGGAGLRARTRWRSRSPATASSATTARSSGYRWGVERKRALLDREARRERAPSARAARTSAADRRPSASRARLARASRPTSTPTAARRSRRC